MSDIDTLRHYYDALRTGDPDRQLANPEDDQVIVKWSIDEISQLQKEVESLRSAVREASYVIRDLYNYRQHAGDCSIDNTVFCTCGLRLTSIAAKDLQDRLINALKEKQ